jgi:hypothetical protein
MTDTWRTALEHWMGGYALSLDKQVKVASQVVYGSLRMGYSLFPGSKIAIWTCFVGNEVTLTVVAKVVQERGEHGMNGSPFIHKCLLPSFSRTGDDLSSDDTSSGL